jgi:caffeoyl-CoA O-methyltransferase
MEKYRRFAIPRACLTMRRLVSGLSLGAVCVMLVVVMDTISNEAHPDEALNARVQAFLDEHARDWHDLNVPYQDGKILHDIIVERGFTRAAEIGTSTGHSTIWIAWALSKTGGKLTTVEIDRRRYDEAIENVAAAGLSDYVEFLLGDAHELVPALGGPYDFVFSDADKDWYINYFDALYPKLTRDACFTAHNVDESRSRRSWQARYLAHVRAVADMETMLHPEARNGIAVTCKTRP